MIIFKNVRYKNLLSTGNAFTEIQLNRSHSTIIMGENGSGKSSILDSLTFVLFGKPFRKVKKNQLLNSINEKGLLVEIEFSVGTTEYLVRRGIKPNVFEIIKNGKPLNQSSTVRDFQEILEKQILKMNYKSFTQIVVLGSSGYVPFMQLSTSARSDVIEDILDIQIFSIMNQILKNRASDLKKEIRDVEYKVDLSNEKILMQEKYVKQVEGNKEKRISELNDELKDRKQYKQRKCTIREEKTKEVELLNGKLPDIDALNKRISKCQNVISNLGVKKRKLTKDISFFDDNDVCPVCTQNMSEDLKENNISELKTSFNEVTDGIIKVKQMYESLNDNYENAMSIQSQINGLNSEISVLNSEIVSSDDYIKRTMDKIENINVGHATGEERETLKQLNDELKKLEDEKRVMIDKSYVQNTALLLLRDNGIKTRIIKQYLPIINKLINSYLSSLDFFVNFELNENFEETIKSRFRDEFSYSSFSEGEKQRINIAILLTWRAIAKLRNSVNCNLLILDETFDSSLDEEGTEELGKILSSFDKDQNVFVISHRGETIIEKFENTIKFVKKGNFSRMI